MAEKQRSPNYPGFGLSEAILKAKQLYEHDGRAAVPKEVAVQAWGYQGLNGASLRALGALRQFGLLEMPNAGSVRITSDAQALILEPEGSQEHLGAMSAVAMRPTVFRALHKQYPDGLPSDAAVVAYLVRNMNFSEDAARVVIASYKDTLRIAGDVEERDDAASAADNGDGAKKSDDHRREPEQKPKKEFDMAESGRESLDFPFPLVTGGQAILRLPRNMSEPDYVMLTTMIDAVLKGMKGALVTAIAPATGPAKEGQ